MPRLEETEKEKYEVLGTFLSTHLNVYCPVWTRFITLLVSCLYNFE